MSFDESEKKFLSGENPIYPNPLEDLSPHLACQYDYYVEAKRVLLQSLKQGAQLPPGAPTLAVARETLVLAEKLTARLQAVVPFAKESETSPSPKKAKTSPSPA